jgi:hypothetical protein
VLKRTPTLGQNAIKVQLYAIRMGRVKGKERGYIPTLAWAWLKIRIFDVLGP